MKLAGFTPPHRTTRGFTLIQLLVVIAVITILAALVMPAMMRAVSLSERTRCSSNMGQILRGCFIYANQNSRYFPNAKPGRTGYGDDDLSRLYDGNYVKNLKTFACPATEDNPEKSEDLRRKATEGGKMSYEYWGEYNPRISMPGIRAGVCTVIMDEDGYHINGETDGDNHGAEGANMGFFDSHVQWLSAPEWTPARSLSAREWNRFQ